MSRSVPWPRILAEGFAIVVSILLAFGIQAWWEGVQEDRQRADLVAELVADFETTRTRIAASVDRADLLLIRLDGFMEAVAAPRSIPRDSTADLFSATTNRLQFAPALANYEAALASGTLGLLDSPRLVESFAEFREALTFWEDNDRLHGEFFYAGAVWELRRRLGSTRVLDGGGNAFVGLTPLPSRLLLSDDEFWTFITSPDVYATAEVARLLFANKRRGLLEMEAAAVSVLEALGRP